MTGSPLGEALGTDQRRGENARTGSLSFRRRATTGKGGAGSSMPVVQRIVQQAFVFALDPTPAQERALASHVGGARFAYNWGLARVAEALDAYTEEKAAGVAKPTTRIPGHFDLCKAWTVWKDTAEWTDRHTGEVTAGVPWVGRNFSGTYQAALRDAAGAWKRFFDSRSGKLGGRRVGRPRFKRKGRAREAFQVHGGTLRVVGAKHIKVPVVGAIHTHESTRKLGRLFRKDDVTCPECRGPGVVSAAKAGETKKCAPCKGTGAVPFARLVRGTISRDSSGRWQIALTVERIREVRTAPSARQRQGGTVGVDFGVRDLATLSSGETLPNPRPLEGVLRRLGAAQRALSRCAPGSGRRARAQRKVGRLHARARNLRADSIAKATSSLVHRHAVIAVEGWDVQQTAQRGSAGLPGEVRRVRNRALADTGIGMARWQLQSRSAWYGAEVVVTDRHAPTGRTCSACGTAKDKPVPATHEEFVCSACGHRVDRRLNTARVLARLATEHKDDAPSGGESVNAHGATVRLAGPRPGQQAALKCVARSRSPGRGNTGTPGT